MKQHSVPQHISSYEFHLIGDMTIKQFGYMVAGGAVAFLFYVSGANFLIKSLGILSGLLLGTSLAFLAIQERPLDRWLINFIRAIYAPTQYLWKKTSRLPDYFQTTSPSFEKIQESLFPQKEKPKVPLAEYLQSLPQPHLPITAAEKAEAVNLQKISLLLQTPFLSPGLISQTPPPEIQKQGLKIRPLSQKQAIKTAPLKTPPPPPPKAKTLSPKKPPLQVPPPPTKPIKPHLESKAPKKPSVEATLKPSLPIPEKPTVPNIIVGMVKDNQGKLVENAILEIQDSKGIPQRALKTNKLGQFQIVTPLKNDAYSIVVEKDNLNFDIIKITLTGKIVPPIEIQAK